MDAAITEGKIMSIKIDKDGKYVVVSVLVHYEPTTNRITEGYPIDSNLLTIGKGVGLVALYHGGLMEYTVEVTLCDLQDKRHWFWVRYDIVKDEFIPVGGWEKFIAHKVVVSSYIDSMLIKALPTQVKPYL